MNGAEDIIPLMRMFILPDFYDSQHLLKSTWQELATTLGLATANIRKQHNQTQINKTSYNKNALPHGET